MPQIAAIWIAMLILMAEVVLTTSKNLTYIITKNIVNPLDMLSFGVTQIRDNNLGFRLDYQEDDEFRPACEDFNEMAVRLETMTVERKKAKKTIMNSLPVFPMIYALPSPQWTCSTTRLVVSQVLQIWLPARAVKNFPKIYTLFPLCLFLSANFDISGS
jgi:methyl-accepting chemotaxis protein